MPPPKQDVAPPVSDAWPEARPLRPLSDAALNEGSSLNPSLKRRRYEPADSYELGEPFSVEDSTSDTHTELLTLTPRLVIPRSCLALAYLDLSLTPDRGGLLGSRLFSARTKSLEILDASGPQTNQPNVLIVEDNSSQRLFAVERVRNGIYALCRITDWATLSDFEAGPAKARKISHGDLTIGTAQYTPWWKAASISLRGNRTVHKHDEEITWRNTRLDLRPPQELAKARSDLLPAVLAESAEQPPSEANAKTIPKGCIMTPSSEPAEILGAIRAQYLEALYIHKTSLAYFAKGPLSRARASTQRDPLPANAVVLNQMLREIIPSVSTNDKKYNDTLPNLLKELLVGITSEDEEGVLGDQIRKSKKRKKIGRGGLLPGEEEYVVKWWFQKEKTTLIGGPGDTREERLRVWLVEQRARETQLQLILIFEVLALESAAIALLTKSDAVTATSELHDIEKQGRAKAPKKSQNLGTLMDILIDRLCIWHSTCQEESEVLHHTQQQQKLTSSTSNGDHLRDFCIEVIVPFYATRLPAELYRSICQKLGGPLVPSPARPLLHKASVSSRTISKPASSVQNTDSKSRQPLQRVLTDGKVARRKAHPTLTRSATDSVLPSIKRELSELAMPAIPPTRPSLQNTKRYSQREVDLTAVSQATEAKLQRKAAIEQELQGAIAALKKPNPRMAVKELVESADRRAASASKSRKSRNPIRNPFGQGVQVMATPRNNRLKNLYPQLQRPSTTQLSEPEEPVAIPPSSDPRIPSSSIRQPAVAVLLPMGDRPVSHHKLPSPYQLFNSVDTTPSRRPSKLANPVLPHPEIVDHDEDEDELSQDSPALPNLPKPQPPLTWSKPLGQIPSFESPLQRLTPAGTPSRKPAGRRSLGVGTPVTHSHKSPEKNKTAFVATGAPCLKPQGPAWSAEQALYSPSDVKSALRNIEVKVEGRGEAGQKSIYEALGWEDEVDELV